MGTSELRASALQNPPLNRKMTAHDYLYSLVLRKEKFLTQNLSLIVSSIPELWTLFPFILICRLKIGKESALLRTVSKTWDLQKLLVSPLGYILHNSTAALKDLQHTRFWVKHPDVALSSTFTPFLRAAAFLFFFAHLWTTKSFLSHKNVFIKSVSAFSLFLCIL